MSILKVNASLGFIQLPIPNKVMKGIVVLAGIDEQSTLLPDLPIDTISLTAINNNLREDSKNAATGNHAAVAAQNVTEKLWNKAFKKTAKYVSLVADGNKAFILSTGFNTTSEESVSKVIPNVLSNFNAASGIKTGEADFTASPEKEAQSYLFALVPSDTIVKQSGNTIIITMGDKTCYITPDIHAFATAKGLISKEELSAYGLALNVKGTGPFVRSNKNICPE